MTEATLDVTVEDCPDTSLSSAPAPSPTPTTPPTTWSYRGSWDTRPIPIESGVSGGVPFLTIHLKADTAVPMSDIRATIEARKLVRDMVFYQLRGGDKYRRLRELHPQVLRARADCEKRQSTVTAREAVRAELLAKSPVPADLAAKLLKADEDIAAAVRLREQARGVLDALTPLYDSAKLAFIEEGIKGGYAVITAAHKQMVDGLIEQILAPLQEHLTHLAIVLHARQKLYSVSGPGTARDVVEELLRGIE